MGCPKNIEKFLRFFSYEGPHEWKWYSIARWASEDWEISFRCAICGSDSRDWLISDASMLRRGFDLEVIRELSKPGRFSDISRKQYEQAVDGRREEARR